MASGIYITPTQFVSFAETRNTASLKQEIASRSAAWDYSGLVGLLPDPDPILKKRGDGVEILESLTGDGHLISVMQSRKLGVMKQEFKFEAGLDDDGNTTSQSEQLCLDFNRDMKELRSRDLISSILDAPYYGMSPVELTFAPGVGRLRLVKAEAKPVRWFGFNETNEPRFRSLDEATDGEALPWGKFVLARHFPTYDNPYGLRLLTRCFWPITFKKGGLKFWVTFMEKYGMPFLLGHYAKGTSPEEQQAMLGKLEKMVRDAVAVVPDGDRIEMLGGAGKTGGGYMVFDKMKSAMDAEVSKVILGQTLTSGTGEGTNTNALGKVHADVLSDFQESDKLLAKDALDEIATIFGQVNAAAVPPPTCKFFEAEDPQQDFAERDKALEESGRLRLKKAYYIRRYGFQDDDFELVDAVGTAAPVTAPAFVDPPAAPGNADHAEDNDPLSAAMQEKKAAQGQYDMDRKVAAYVLEGGKIFAKWKELLGTWLQTMESLDAALTNLPDLLQPDSPMTKGSRLTIDWLESSMLAALLDSDRLGTASVPTTEDHAETIWGAGKPFKESLDYFKAKSFTIAGQTRADVVAAVKDELQRHMADGGDMRGFRANIDEIFKRHGLDTLAPHHIETIYRTNMQGAYQAGRYVQMTKPYILKARPFWKYIAIKDGLTRPDHLAMNGKIFHHEDPIWQTWKPPNGFNCRCDVVTLSQREITRDGLQVLESDNDGAGFEVLDKETGEIKVFSPRPDPGWGGDSGTLESLLTAQKRDGGGTQLWREVAEQPGPLELMRQERKDIAQEQWQDVALEPSLEKLMVKGLAMGEALAMIEKSYKKQMGISPLETQGVLRAKDGEALTVTVQGLAHAMVKRDDARERYIPHLRQVLENPYEILLTEYITEGGATKYRKKYIGLFVDEKKEAVIIVAELLPDGAVLWNIMNTRDKNIDRHRRGIKLIYGRK